MVAANATWVIVLTLVLAITAHALPLDMGWRWFRPDIPALVLFYWTLALPHRVGIFTAALVGVGVSILEAAPVGAYSLGLVASTLMILFTYQRLRLFNLLQQSFLMGLLLGLALVVEQWLQSLMGNPAPGLIFLMPALTSILVWPLVRKGLRGLRRYYEVT